MLVTQADRGSWPKSIVCLGISCWVTHAGLLQGQNKPQKNKVLLITVPKCERWHSSCSLFTLILYNFWYCCYLHKGQTPFICYRVLSQLTWKWTSQTNYILGVGLSIFIILECFSVLLSAFPIFFLMNCHAALFMKTCIESHRPFLFFLRDKLPTFELL